MHQHLHESQQHHVGYETLKIWLVTNIRSIMDLTRNTVLDKSIMDLLRNVVSREINHHGSIMDVIRNKVLDRFIMDFVNGFNENHYKYAQNNRLKLQTFFSKIFLVREDITLKLNPTIHANQSSGSCYAMLPCHQPISQGHVQGTEP